MNLGDRQLATGHSKLLALAWVALLSACVGVHAAGPSTVVTSATEILSERFGDYIVQSGSLYGPPGATSHGVKIHGNITVTGPALLQDLFVDGCILVDRANRVELLRVWQQGCRGDGITFQSDRGGTETGGDQACCAKLDHVVAFQNSGAGLKLINTADVFVVMSEFENNVGCGVRLVNSPTARIVNSDFGGNAICGFWADATSHMTMLTNNQWGNNRGDDLVLESQNNIVNSAEFIGPAGACAIRSIGPQHIGTNSYGPRPLC